MKVKDLSRYNRLGWGWGWESAPAELEGPTAPSLQVWQHATGAILFSELGAGEQHRLEVKVDDRQLVIEWETAQGTFEQTVELPFLPDARDVRVELGEQAVNIIVPRSLRDMRARLSVQPAVPSDLEAAA